mgnify:CR=1 FL=1
MANFTRVGYGQVEPNQLSAQKTGQIYASLPLDPKVEVLQNGEFMFYDYATGKVTAEGKGEPMLVFNEIKLYEPFWRTSYKDFAMIRVGDNYVTSKLATAEYGDGALTTGATIDPGHTEYPYRMDGIAPRLFKTNIGDIYTTNMVETGVEYSVGDELELKKVENTGADGVSTYNTLVLAKDVDAAAVGTIKFVVAKVYTMPDGQPGLKIQRIA